MADEEAEEAEEEEEEEEDVFYAPSFVDRRRKRHKKNTGDDEDEEEEAVNTKDVFGGTSSSSSSDDDDDDEKEEEEEEEEEETKKDARTRREEEAGVVVSESESESDQSFPRKAALKNTCNNVSRRERTTRAGAVDEKTREATALMRELTKRTDAKILDEDEGEEEIAEKDEKGNNDDDDDDDDILSHYEPITLVFALSNTNKLELETCAKFTFKRIWTDFVSMHVLEGNAEKARLNFDGDVIKFDEDTPKSLGMENDDCVDVIM